MRVRLLLIETTGHRCSVLPLLFGHPELTVFHYPSLAEARGHLATHEFDLVLIDPQVGDVEEVAAEMVRIHRRTPVVLLTNKFVPTRLPFLRTPLTRRQLFEALAIHAPALSLN